MAKSQCNVSSGRLAAARWLRELAMVLALLCLMPLLALADKVLAVFGQLLLHPNENQREQFNDALDSRGFDVTFPPDVKILNTGPIFEIAVRVLLAGWSHVLFDPPFGANT